MTTVLEQLYIENLESGRARLAAASLAYAKQRSTLGKLQSALGMKCMGPEDKDVLRAAIRLTMGEMNRSRAEYLNAITNLELLLNRTYQFRQRMKHLRQPNLPLDGVRSAA